MIRTCRLVTSLLLVFLISVGIARGQDMATRFGLGGGGVVNPSNRAMSEDDLGIDPAVTDRLGAIMSRVGEADFERVDPPAVLWERIETTLLWAVPKNPPPAILL